jgi:hypothetical protein
MPMRNLAMAALAAAAASVAGGAQAQDLVSAIQAGKPILEARLRYEDVDQGNFARDAQALTLRSRFGWETGAWNHLTGLAEGEATSRLGPEHFNDSLNHRTLYPGVTDPQTLELHRLQLAWAPSKAVSVTVGRQRLNIDDLRFVASPGWRQDEQTFDAARLDARLRARLAEVADYAIRAREPYGVWGGLTEGQRQVIYAVLDQAEARDPGEGIRAVERHLSGVAIGTNGDATQGRSRR